MAMTMTRKVRDKKTSFREYNEFFSSEVNEDRIDFPYLSLHYSCIDKNLSFALLFWWWLDVSTLTASFLIQRKEERKKKKFTYIHLRFIHQVSSWIKVFLNLLILVENDVH